MYRNSSKLHATADPVGIHGGGVGREVGPSESGPLVKSDPINGLIINGLIVVTNFSRCTQGWSKRCTWFGEVN